MKPIEYVKDILIFALGLGLIFTLSMLSNEKDQHYKAAKSEYEYRMEIVDLKDAASKQEQVIEAMTDKILDYQTLYGPIYEMVGE